VTAEPLHVQVARALGCKPDHGSASSNSDVWFCPCGVEDYFQHTAHGEESGTSSYLARYDNDWSATGPLIELYCGEVSRVRTFAVAFVEKASEPIGEPIWRAWDKTHHYAGDGPTPLIAVCALLLVLADAGKLKAAA
jgi:hypothetical protein